MPRQLTFDLPVRAALGREDYFVSDANSAAVAAIAAWRDWPGAKLVLSGPKAAGKTHLVHVWAADAQAQIVAARDLAKTEIGDLVARSSRIAVEDIAEIAGDAAGEQALLHLHNMMLAQGGRLLLSCQDPPARLPLQLADLKSRVMGAGLVQLGAPDDALLSAVLVKLFTDRQISVPPAVISYLAPRMERSFDAAGRIVAALDAAALAQRGGVTRKLAATVLEKFVRDSPF